jgi:2-polyprenyl-3-methyl-5-hydroxy-6-metoxy-1,4-benzoquinol methylase
VARATRRRDRLSSVSDTPGTDVPAYADRLQTLERARWKQLLDVQAPYRWNIRRLGLGRTLDIGCGLGRNLAHLGGQGVGVDHNPTSVEVARRRGLQAYTAEEFLAGPLARPGSFDALLAAHVVEHMPEADAVELFRTYLPFVRAEGKVVIITPQEKGYTTDATHVRFCGFDEVAALCAKVGGAKVGGARVGGAKVGGAKVGLRLVRQYSFPFPRPAGRVFPYNEFVTLARTQAVSHGHGLA